MIAIFTLAMAANESREAAISGEYFEIRNALFPIALIELLDRTGTVISLLQNPEQSDFVKPGRFETVRITNGPTAQTIKHFYGSGDAGSRRTSGLVRIDGASDVSVIDGEKNRTLAGGMFGGTPQCPGVSATFANTQLWNPAGSGKNLIVTSVAVAAFGAAGIFIAMTNVQLLTASTYAPANKRAGGVAPNALLRIDTRAAVDPMTFGSLHYVPVLQNTQYVWAVRGALVVTPGFGLIVANATAAITLVCSFEWFEEPI